jgi:serine/threonine protein kinase
MKKYLLVMEYADSGTLKNYLREHFDSLNWNDKLDLALQLANVISCLHDKGIVHNNLVINIIYNEYYIMHIINLIILCIHM